MKYIVWFSLFGLLIGCSAKKDHKKLQEKYKSEEHTKEVIQVASSEPAIEQSRRYPSNPLHFKGIAELGLDDEARSLVNLLSSAAKGKVVYARLKHESPGFVKKVLLGALSWSNPNARIQAAIIAAKLHVKDEEMVNRLIEGLLRDPDPDCRSQTAAAFVNLKDRRGAKALLYMLNHDPHPMARANAAWALGVMRYRPAVPSLIKALDHPYTWVRLRAASALKHIRARAAVEGIKRRLRKEKNPLVKKRLRQALAACRRGR